MGYVEGTLIAVPGRTFREWQRDGGIIGLSDQDRTALGVTGTVFLIEEEFADSVVGGGFLLPGESDPARGAYAGWVELRTDDLTGLHMLRQGM